jgi:aminobenzoyl-glutamate utilization protein B
VIDQTGQIGRGSTDVGGVSWTTPTAGFSTACWVPGTPAHSWQACAAGGTSLGRKGMGLAARVLAATAWDLFQQPHSVAAARNEFSRRLRDKAYAPLMQPGQMPALDYRNPPKTRSEGSGQPQRQPLTP